MQPKMIQFIIFMPNHQFLCNQEGGCRSTGFSVLKIGKRSKYLYALKDCIVQTHDLFGLAADFQVRMDETRKPLT